MKSDVITNKISILRRCIHRIQEVYVGHEKELGTNFDIQDIVILNLQRACEAAIDLGMHVVKQKELGAPQGSRDVFVLLERQKFLTPNLSHKLQAMVGFRNIAVHSYQEIKPEILQAILDTRLGDFEEFIVAVKKIPEL